MKKTLMFALLAALSGCASLQNAGTEKYSIEPFTDEAGKVSCCKMVFENGKEIKWMKASVRKFGNDFSMDIEQRGVTAFEGQATAASAERSALDAAGRVAAAVLAPVTSTNLLAPFAPVSPAQ